MSSNLIGGSRIHFDLSFQFSLHCEVVSGTTNFAFTGERSLLPDKSGLEGDKSPLGEFHFSAEKRRWKVSRFQSHLSIRLTSLHLRSLLRAKTSFRLGKFINFTLSIFRGKMGEQNFFGCVVLSQILGTRANRLFDQFLESFGGKIRVRITQRRHGYYRGERVFGEQP